MNLTKLNVPAYSDRLGICALCKTTRVVLRGIVIAEMQNCRNAVAELQKCRRTDEAKFQSIHLVVEKCEHTSCLLWRT